MSYPVGRSAFAGRLYGGVGLLALAVAVTWCRQSDALGWRHALVLAALGLAGVLAARSWLASPRGVLRWDGAQWQWEQGREVSIGRCEIALDLQSRLLVRFHPEGGRALWLWVERQAKSADWEALRRAVYSRANAPIPPLPTTGRETPPAGEPPAAEQ